MATKKAQKKATTVTEGEPQYIWVAPGPKAVSDRVILSETNDMHPDGEAFIAAKEGAATQVGLTSLVSRKLATGELREATAEEKNLAESRKEMRAAALNPRTTKALASALTAALEGVGESTAKEQEEQAKLRESAKKSAEEENQKLREQESKAAAETSQGTTLMSGSGTGGTNVEEGEARGDASTTGPGATTGGKRTSDDASAKPKGGR